MIKNIILTFAFFCATFQQIYAQLKIVDAGGNIITNAITVVGEASNTANTPIQVDLRVKNTGSSTIQVKASMTRITVATGHTNNYICWGTICYPSNVTAPAVEVAINANEQAICTADIAGANQGTAPLLGGNTTIDYTFFEVGNVSNTVTIRVNYQVANNPNSLEPQVLAGMTIGALFPNPTEGKASVKIQNGDANKSLTIEITDLEGRLVANVVAATISKELDIKLPKLRAGFYTYKYVVNGKDRKSVV